MLESLSSAFDLLLVIIGFGMVIFVHELGHFLAAKWAGVRVHQFAIGFGSPIISWRKGMGFAVGSTEQKALKLLKKKHTDEGVEPTDLTISDVEFPPGISPTEYRLNWIPFGGYVKMLGQEDLDPAAASQSPDSYTQKPVWKRMVIISAGVVMNIILAAVLFVIVYMVGRDVVTPRIGTVAQGMPGASAQLVSGDPGDTPAKLMPGDVITRIAGEEPKSFNDVQLEVVMSRRGKPIEIQVERAGVPSPLTFEATPRQSDVTGMLEVGIAPSLSNKVVSAPKGDEATAARIREALNEVGLVGVDPGMTLVSVNGQPVDALWPLTEALQDGHGQAVRAVFESDAGNRTMVDVRPWPEMQQAEVAVPRRDEMTIQPHLLGLAPACRIASVEARAREAGVEEGDVIVQAGSVAWPDMATLMGEIARQARGEIQLTVLRDGDYVSLTAPVDSRGRIGIGIALTERTLSVVTRVPRPVTSESASNADETDATAPELAASRLDLSPGAIIREVDGAPVQNFFMLWRALRGATAEANQNDTGAEVQLQVQRPIGGAFGEGPTERVSWSLTSDDVKTLHALGWVSPIEPILFDLDEKLLRTSNPMQAIVWGVEDTHNMMMKTYLTFVRLFQGTVRVDQLKGPVGIAHLGTMVAERGLMDLLFFLGLISVNLAVINFLPIPIADGGHFVMLLIERITGKPVSPAIQNITALAGLALIATVFIVVTFNDLSNLFGG